MSGILFQRGEKGEYGCQNSEPSSEKYLRLSRWKHGFSERYFKRCFKEAREEIGREKREVRVPDNEDVEEPVDFSHLFSDVKKSE